MSWYDEDFRKRAAITALNTGGVAAGDVDVRIPQDWDEFWDAIDSDGEELRITSANGRTLLGYTVDDGGAIPGAFDKVNRAGRIRIDNATFTSTANEVVLFWVYFDTASAQGDGSSGAAAGGVNGFIDRGAPTYMAMALLPQRLGVTRPRDVFAKGAGESLHIWCDLTDALEQRRTPSAKRRILEEPYKLTITAVDEGGSSATSVVDAAQCSFVETMGKGGRGRRIWARLGVTAGSSGTNYTVRATLTTVYPNLTGSIVRTLVISAGLQVETVIEPAT